MRLQLIMSLAADVLHKSSPLHPGCFHGDGASNCGAPARSPAAPAKVDAGAGSPSALPWVSAGLWDRAGKGGSPRDGDLCSPRARRAMPGGEGSGAVPRKYGLPGC